MNNNAADKGMTLIELIIALAILGIITVAFLNGFTGAFTTILGMGHKTVAMAEAQTLMDQIYEAGTATEAYIESLGAVDTLFSEPYVTGDHLRYALTSKSVGGKTSSQVSLLVFYQNGKRYITLTSLIP